MVNLQERQYKYNLKKLRFFIVIYSVNSTQNYELFSHKSRYKYQFFNIINYGATSDKNYIFIEILINR